MLNAAVPVLLLALACACAPASGARPAPERPASERMTGAANFLTGYPATNGDGTLNAVVEIPSGTNAKWEATEDGSALEWERQDGALRVVRYLPYPGNYGMVPRTRQAADRGGDGDPLDVLVLGPAAPRGAVLAARPVAVLRLLDDGERDDKMRPVAVLRLLDDGERDDKILAVTDDGPLGEVRDLVGLERRFPGVTAIVETWFTHYKGPGRIRSEGFAGRAEALAIVREAAEAFAAGGR
jgi:inorganic pyrophosphatase